jgi:hypothetical protein
VKGIPLALALGLCLWAIIASAAFGHANITDAENEWLNRQRAIDGTKCCDRHDTHVGEGVEWRIERGRYQVRIQGAWRDVPPERVMRHNPADPTPWPGQALLFWSPVPSHPDGFLLWCFFPEPLT